MYQEERKGRERTKPPEWYGHGIVDGSVMNGSFHGASTQQQHQAHPNLLINTFSQTTL